MTDEIKNVIKNVIDSDVNNLSALMSGTLILGENDELIEILDNDNNTLSIKCYTSQFSEISDSTQYKYLNEQYNIAYPFACYWHYHISSVIDNTYVNKIRNILVSKQNYKYQSLSNACIVDSENNLVFLANHKLYSNIDLNEFKSIQPGSIAGCEQLVTCKISSSALTTASFIGSEITNLSILVPDNYSFPKSCFCDCYELNDVYISNAKSIVFDDYCFSECLNLTSMHFNIDDYFQINEGAFENCSNLVSIDLAKCTYIGKDAFSNCENLSNVNAIQAYCIEAEAFNYCKNIQNIVLCSTVYELHKSCFSHCSQLNNIKLPSSISVLENEIFSMCKKLTNLSIEMSQYFVNNFKKDIFLWNTNLSNIHLLNTSNFDMHSIIQNLEQLSSGMYCHPILSITY